MSIDPSPARADNTSDVVARAGDEPDGVARAGDTARPGGMTRVRGAARIIGAVLVVVALMVGGRRLAEFVPAITGWVAASGGSGPLLFIAAYAVATVLFVPGSVLTLGAGALFGIPAGTAYVLVGATIGETAAFLIARYVARRMVERRIAGSPRLAALDVALAREGWRTVLLLRLSPLIPFNLLNYSLGVTRVSLRDFMVASVGIAPGTLLYVYYGHVAGELAAAAAGAAPAPGLAHYALLGVGLVATIVATVLISRAARRALASATEGTLS